MKILQKMLAEKRMGKVCFNDLHEWVIHFSLLSNLKVKSEPHNTFQIVFRMSSDTNAQIPTESVTWFSL